jgi:hypothetical protein
MTTWNRALNVRNPISKLYDFKKNNGTTERIAVSNLQLHKEASGALTPITGVLTTNTTKFLTYKSRSINDAVLIADGGKLKVYNGTNVSEVTPHIPTISDPNATPSVVGEDSDPGLNDLASLTNFRTLALKKDRFFAAAHPTVKNRVSFCYFDPYIGYGVYDYWPAIYFFDVASEDNDEIIELKVFRDLLVILCKKSVWALRGDGVTLNDNEVFKINVPNGCIAPGSVQEVGNNLFYLADDHVYSIFATEHDFVSGQIMSDKIAPILKSIGNTDKALATSNFFDNKYYLSFPSGLTLVYDVTLESWTKFTNIKANSFIIRDGVLYFSTDNGMIYQFNENLYSDDGDPISFQMKTKLLDLGSPINEKKFRMMWILSKQWDNYLTSFDVNLLIDQYLLENFDGLIDNTKSGDSGVWDISKWDEVKWDFSETTQNAVKIGKKGRDIQFQITNDNVNEPVSIQGIVIEYEMKKPKRR